MLKHIVLYFSAFLVTLVLLGGCNRSDGSSKSKLTSVDDLNKSVVADSNTTSDANVTTERSDNDGDVVTEGNITTEDSDDENVVIDENVTIESSGGEATMDENTTTTNPDDGSVAVDVNTTTEHSDDENVTTQSPDEGDTTTDENVTTESSDDVNITDENATVEIHDDDNTDVNENTTPTPTPTIINRHTLPPMPDKRLNDATLLGIDSNNNGVRDDVEIWIYETYKDKHPIYIDIAMQAGRSYKKILEMPEKAIEIDDEVTAPYYCLSYYKDYAKYFNEPLLFDKNDNITDDVYRIYFNTDDRMDTYDEYDTLLSGGMYPLPKLDKMKSFCDFNTSKYGN